MDADDVGARARVPEDDAVAVARARARMDGWLNARARGSGRAREGDGRVEDDEDGAVCAHARAVARGGGDATGIARGVAMSASWTLLGDAFW